jgi:hypothetical protein
VVAFAQGPLEGVANDRVVLDQEQHGHGARVFQTLV